MTLLMHRAAVYRNKYAFSCCCCCYDEPAAYMGGQRDPKEMRNSTRLWIWRIRLSLVVVNSHLFTGIPLNGGCHCPQPMYCQPLSNNQCWQCRQTVKLQSVSEISVRYPVTDYKCHDMNLVGRRSGSEMTHGIAALLCAGISDWRSTSARWRPLTSTDWPAQYTSGHFIFP